MLNEGIRFARHGLRKFLAASSTTMESLPLKELDFGLQKPTAPTVFPRIVFRGIYSFQVLPAAATKRGRLLLSSVKGKIIEWVIVVKEIPMKYKKSPAYTDWVRVVPGKGR